MYAVWAERPSTADDSLSLRVPLIQIYIPIYPPHKFSGFYMPAYLRNRPPAADSAVKRHQGEQGGGGRIYTNVEKEAKKEDDDDFIEWKEEKGNSRCLRNVNDYTCTISIICMHFGPAGSSSVDERHERRPFLSLNVKNTKRTTI